MFSTGYVCALGHNFLKSLVISSFVALSVIVLIVLHLKQRQLGLKIKVCSFTCNLKKKKKNIYS